MKCSDLKPGDQVVYKISGEYWDGTVALVVPGARIVHACRLEGYRNRDDAVPFEDMAAKYNPSGEDMRFGNITGPSMLLEPD